MVQNVSSEWWFHKETTGCIKKNKAGHTGKRGFHRFLDAEDRNNRVCHDSDPFENAWALCSFHVGRLHIGCPKIDCPPVFQSLSFPQPIGWSLENCNMREESREMVQSQQSLRSREPGCVLYVPQRWCVHHQNIPKLSLQDLTSNFPGWFALTGTLPSSLANS